MPRITYESKRFASETLDAIHTANRILEDYAQQGYDLTLRQLFYQHVARGLVDAANEYHLWVLPEGQGSPLGLEGRGVGEPADQMDHASYRQGGSPGARQRAWEDGLPTGPHYDDR